MTEKKKLTIEKHLEIARSLKEMTDKLADILVDVSNSYPNSLGATKNLKIARQRIIETRSKLEDEMINDSWLAFDSWSVKPTKVYFSSEPLSGKDVRHLIASKPLQSDRL